MANSGGLNPERPAQVHRTARKDRPELLEDGAADAAIRPHFQVLRPECRPCQPTCLRRRTSTRTAHSGPTNVISAAILLARLQTSGLQDVSERIRRPPHRGVTATATTRERRF